MLHDRFALAVTSLFISSVILWVLLAVAVINHFAARDIPLEAPGAAATVIIGAMLLLSCKLRKRDEEARSRMREEYERREAAVIKTASYAVARFRATEPFPTPPFPVQRPYVVR